jgi:cell division protein FtsI/penicillin-binding protein 2
MIRFKNKKKTYVTREIISTRVALVAVFITVLFLVIAARLYFIQVIRHQELYEKAKKNYTVTIKSEGHRGLIFDFNGELLAGNKPCADIIADPSYKLFSSDEKCVEIAKYFGDACGSDYETILSRLRRKKTEAGRDIRYALLAKNIPLELVEKIKEEIREKKWKGIDFNYKTKRYYPKNELLSNVLGFVNINAGETVPQGGIEKVRNERMKAVDGASEIERDRKGIPFEFGEHIINKTHDGNDIYLTVIEPIQMIVEDELEIIMKKFSPKAAYAVMVSPQNGNIMAIAQRPTFNPNDRNSMNDPEARRDKVISDAFEPGSVMKAVSIAGALDYGVVSPNDKLFCENGAWFFAGKILRDAHPYGILSVKEIIQKSSNIGTAKIATMMGEERLYLLLKRFGFGQKTGIPIQPEATGIFRKLEQWDKLSVSRFPIGQGISVSPLQLVRAYCALANGGKLVQIRLIDREANPDTGESVKIQEASAPRVFIRNGTCEKIVEMLKLVTKKGGTAETAAIDGYEVAGKTGTSQKWENGFYSESRFHASFIGFVPADDPAFVLLIMVDEPQGCHYGGIVAAPTFRNIAEKTLRYLNIQPLELSQSYSTAPERRNTEHF